MKIFNIFKKKDNIITTTNKIDYDYNNCVEIAKIISNNNSNVIKEIKECVINPNLYYERNKSKYKERGIDNSSNIDTVIWIGLVNCLIKNNCLCERDYKDELEDFIYFMNSMNYDVKFDKEELNENGYVADWCAELDKKLQPKNLCVGGVDIDSDSYVMFICERNTLEKLSQLAKNINHNITFASKL